MARIYMLTTFILLATSQITTSFDLNCKYEYTNGYAVIGRVYICVSSNINMPTPESAQISNIIGTHEGQKSNDVVDGFHANRQVMNYFPQGLDNFFPNLQSVAVMRCGLKEIHQTDLKPFPGLRSLNMYDNKLQVIEEGLMDFNPNLEVVGFHGNRLVHVDPNVFNNLNKMTDLYLEGVPCIDKNTDTREETLNAVKIMKTQCVDAEFLDMDKQVNNLINETEILSPEEFNNKLDKMDKVVSDYEFSNFRPLSDSIKTLRSLKMDIPATEPIEDVAEVTMPPTEVKDDPKKDQDSAIDMKLGNLSEEVNNLVTDTLANVNNLKMIQDATDESIKELKAAQDATKSYVESIDEKVKAIETQVQEKFASLDKKLDSILRALRIGE